MLLLFIPKEKKKRNKLLLQPVPSFSKLIYLIMFLHDLLKYLETQF